MNITFVNNAIIIDSKDIEIEKINVDGLVSNTANTWQAERSVQEKRADTELGKFAEDAVITALKVLGLNYYHSYDSFRSDNFKLHAPFDGLLIKNLTSEIVNLINNSVVTEGNKLSAATREKIRKLGGLTVEVKSTRLAKKYKDRASFSGDSDDESVKRIVEELSSLDFLTYPYFTRYGDMTFDQYCGYAETHYLHTWKRGQELRDYVKQIELANASDFYIRVFVDEECGKVIILGCIDRQSFFAYPRTHKLILPGKSEVPLYFVKKIREGYSLKYLANLIK